MRDAFLCLAFIGMVLVPCIIAMRTSPAAEGSDE